MRFARIEHREVRVEVKTSAVPPGYRIAKLEVAPATIRIAGPEKRVAAVESAQTDLIELAAVTSATELTVNAYVPDPQVRLESSAAVKVKITLEKIGNEK